MEEQQLEDVEVHMDMGDAPVTPENPHPKSPHRGVLNFSFEPGARSHALIKNQARKSLTNPAWVRGVRGR
jgi:hypothetical protein